MSLKKYNEKRDFSKTKEPEGKKKSSGSSRIFVVQKHEASRLHYDFRLEWEGTLLSWAVPKGPSYNPKDKRLAVEVEPHPYDYKDFEGTIPKGEYGGGTVMLWDEGTWEEQEGEDFSKGLKEGSLKIILHGERLQGKWTLVRMNPKEGEKKNNWLLIKEKDDFIKDEAGIDEFTTSVRSHRSMVEIEGVQEEIPSYSVQLATKRDKIPKGDDWIYELKYDGYRILAILNGESVTLLSRNQQEYTESFSHIVKEMKKWDVHAVIDGEIVINKDGRSDFQSLQQYIKTKKGTKPIFMAFDLLYLNQDLVENPLEERKKKLEALLQEHKNDVIFYSSHVEDGESLFKTVCQHQMEGVMGKNKQAAYVQGRSKSWVKIKCDNRQEFIVIGFTQSDKRTRAISSLLVGVQDGNAITYAGRVGTGFTEESAEELSKKLRSLHRKTAPIEDPPKPRSGEMLQWVTPKIIVEVRFAELTEDGIIRQGSYLGMRTDKSPKEVVIEKEELPEKKPKKPPKKKTKEREITLSSPEKKLFENFTKKDIWDYYEKMKKKILPYIENRVLTLVRCPSGVKDCFYQKNVQEHFQYIHTQTVKENDGEKADYMALDSTQGILEGVQFNTIEFHTWGSRLETLEQPDVLFFDLDPDEGMDVEDVRQGVRDLKSILDSLGLVSFLKTSGNKGYHVVIPLEPSGDWEAVREFAKNVATVMEQKWPKKYTANMRKEKRKGKIYIDWVRNGRGSTLVAPYCVRAKEPGAVSAPIDWDELSTIGPQEMTMEKMMRRRKDPWKEFFTVKQKIG